MNQWYRLSGAAWPLVSMDVISFLAKSCVQGRSPLEVTSQSIWKLATSLGSRASAPTVSVLALAPVTTFHQVLSLSKRPPRYEVLKT